MADGTPARKHAERLERLRIAEERSATTDQFLKDIRSGKCDPHLDRLLDEIEARNDAKGG